MLLNREPLTLSLNLYHPQRMLEAHRLDPLYAEHLPSTVSCTLTFFPTKGATPREKKEDMAVECFWRLTYDAFVVLLVGWLIFSQ